MLHIYSYLLSTKQDEATTTTAATAAAAAAALWEFAVHLVETLTILYVEVALLRSNTTVLVYHHWCRLTPSGYMLSLLTPSGCMLSFFIHSQSTTTTTTITTDTAG